MNKFIIIFAVLMAASMAAPLAATESLAGYPKVYPKDGTKFVVYRGAHNTWNIDEQRLQYKFVETPGHRIVSSFVGWVGAAPSGIPNFKHLNSPPPFEEGETKRTRFHHVFSWNQDGLTQQTGEFGEFEWWVQFNAIGHEPIFRTYILDIRAANPPPWYFDTHPSHPDSVAFQLSLRPLRGWSHGGGGSSSSGCVATHVRTNTWLLFTMMAAVAVIFLIFSTLPYRRGEFAYSGSIRILPSSG